MIFPVNGVADVVAFVLDSPVFPDMQVYARGSHLTELPDREDEGILLADRVTGYLKYLAADEGGPAGVRKVYAVRAGNPTGTFLNASAAAFLYDVMRHPADQRKDRVEYCPLQGRLVSLDRYHVAKSRLPANGPSRFMLNVSSVHREQG